jgi:hypothetical protein
MTAHLPNLLLDAGLAWLLLVSTVAAVAVLPWSRSRLEANALHWHRFGQNWSGLVRAPAERLPELDWEPLEASTAV